MLVANGTQKAKLKDPMLINQDVKGNLTYDAFIPSGRNTFAQARLPIGFHGFRSFSTAVNTESKTHYLIAGDDNKTSIYNVNKIKVERTVPRKEIVLK